MNSPLVTILTLLQKAGIIYIAGIIVLRIFRLL